MACDLTLGRLEPCKDSVGGIKNIYFVDFGKLGVVSYDSTHTDVLDDFTGSTIGATAGSLTAYKYELKGASSFEQTVVSSRDTGTTFYEQTLHFPIRVQRTKFEIGEV
jgi:hypothetical protein